MFRRLQWRRMIDKVSSAHPTWLTLFPEAHRSNQVGMARPIRRMCPVFHKAVKARIGPVRHAGDVPVFDRVVMEVVAVAFEIPLIANRLFPEPALPDAPAPIAVAGIRQGLLVAARRQPGWGEVLFDRAPAFGIVGIIRRQGPDGMNMVAPRFHSIRPTPEMVRGGVRHPKRCAVRTLRGFRLIVIRASTLVICASF